MTTSEAIRTVALIGPHGSGKTTLLESLLFCSGAVGRKGKIAEGTTVGDASAEARAHAMSVELNFASFEHRGVWFNLIDAPGSVEFLQETRNALIGVDLAIVVIEPAVEKIDALAPLIRWMDETRLPHIVFVNKMDRSNVRYRELLDAIRNVSTLPVAPHQYAIGRGEDLVGYVDLVTEQAYHYHDEAPSDAMPLPEAYREREQAARAEMLETLADFDDDLMETLLEDEQPSSDEILRHLQKTLKADQVVQVFMGVAERSMGVRRLLDALIEETPEPGVALDRLGIARDGPPLVQILKTLHLPHAGKLSVARVWRGPIEDGGQLGGERISGVHRLQGGATTSIGRASAGDVVGLGRLDAAQTGDALGPAGVDHSVRRPEKAQPMYGLEVAATNRKDEVKLSAAFHKLAEEDPALELEQNAEMRQTILWGQGEAHLRTAIERLTNRHNVTVETSEPRTAYRETITKRSSARGRHKKQSGGHGQFADVHIEIEPLARGEGFAFASKVVGGAVPKSFVPAVEAGAREFMARGPLGFPMVDLSVRLIDGQHHSVDSNELSFKLATALALKEGLPQCGPVLLEPIWRVALSTPSDATSKVLQLVTAKRGHILGYQAKPGWSGWDEITADIPEAECRDLIVHLRSSTHGVAFFTWRHDHLAETPTKIARDIVAARKAALAA